MNNFSNKLACLYFLLFLFVSLSTHRETTSQLGLALLLSDAGELIPFSSIRILSDKLSEMKILFKLRLEMDK